MNQKGFVVAALLLAISLAALDGTVVGTVMPTIIGQLGGLAYFSWAFSVYLLASTVTVPLYGKLADLYGRKPVLIFGCLLFIVGSLLCGVAGSMAQFIIFRAVQGLGAGAVLPITITVVGDLFSIEERARIQGVFSSVWGVTSLAGPGVGALIAEGMSWRWVFLVNLPLGAATVILLWRFFDERPQKQAHVLDYWGTLLLAGSATALLLGLLQGVDAYGWFGAPTLTLFGVSALLLVLFVLQEQRAAEPVLPLWLFRNKVIVVSSLATFIIGGMMFGVTSYVPLFAQGVLGGTALDAGLIVLPMSIGWPLATVLSGRVILRFGYYTSILIGGVFLVLGSAELLMLSRDSSELVGMAGALIVGMGMGFQMPALVISVQNAVDWRNRGVATATGQFFRSIGGSISVAVMGAVLASHLATRLVKIEGVPLGADADTLLNARARAALSPDVLEAMQRALASSLHEIFLLGLAGALIAFATVLFFPRGSAQELAASAEAASEAMGEAPAAEKTTFVS
ncbi:MAG TPA: MDR family MFS transporter [Dehalococcoidia bacterium]